MRYHRFLPISLLGLIGSLLLLRPATALAHPLDAYLQASYLTLSGEQLIVDVDLTPGVLTAPVILPLIDTNQNEAISEAEGAAYVEQITAALRLEANGQPLPMTLTAVEFPPYLDLTAGTGVIRLHLSADLPETLPGDYQLFYENAYAVPDVINTYLVNAFIDAAARDQFHITNQQRDYDQHTLTLDYTVLALANQNRSSAVVQADQTTSAVDASSTIQQMLIGYLHDEPLSHWLLTALGLDSVLHTLTPD
jgi:nickel/cobalt transporter (NicO) family protein